MEEKLAIEWAVKSVAHWVHAKVACYVMSRGRLRFTLLPDWMLVRSVGHWVDYLDEKLAVEWAVKSVAHWV